MSWDNVLRMLRLRSVPMPDDNDDPELTAARTEVEHLHRKAERVLDEYAEAEQQRVRNGRSKR